MATSIATGCIYAPISTAAHVNDVGSRLSAAFDAVGLTKTADTGQIDFSTNVGTSGYEIRTWGSLTIKIAYSIASTMFTGTWTFGTGSDGSGTLTGGFGGTSYFPSGTAGYASGAMSAYISSDATRVFCASDNTYNCVLSLQQSAQSDDAGHPYLGQLNNSFSSTIGTTNALSVTKKGGSPTGSIGSIYQYPPLALGSTNLGSAMWGSADAANIEVFTTKYRWSKAMAWTRNLSRVMVWAGEIPDWTPFTVSIGGVDYTYITHQRFNIDTSAYPGLRYAYRWE